MADTKEIITCPACGKDMTKIYFEDINKNVDICKNCGGKFFDANELQEFRGDNKTEAERTQDFNEKLRKIMSGF